MFKSTFVPFHSLYTDYCNCTSIHDMHFSHYHDAYEVYLQISGKRYFFFNDICNELGPGDIYFINPLLMHYSQSLGNPSYERFVVNFTKNDLSLLLNKQESDFLLQKMKIGIFHLNKEQCDRIRYLMTELHNCHHSDVFLHDKMQASYLLQILVHLMDCMNNNPAVNIDNQYNDTFNDILSAIDYLNNNYEKTITLNEIAEYSHMSKYHFCRQFHEVTGTTFLTYLHNIRLSKVHQMLLETSDTLEQIAEQTGFTSGVQLSRTFTTAYKISPSVFRKNKGTFK